MRLGSSEADDIVKSIHAILARRKTILLAASLAYLPSMGLASEKECQIAVTPDVQVSKGRSLYNENERSWSGNFRDTQIAMNPRNEKNLLVSATYERGELAAPGKSDDQ